MDAEQKLYIPHADDNINKAFINAAAQARLEIINKLQAIHAEENDIDADELENKTRLSIELS